MSSKVKKLPNLEFLHECFEVDFAKGLLVWKTRPQSHFDSLKGWKIANTKNAGKVAGSLDAKGYMTVGLGKFGSLKCHKLIYFMYHGEDVPYVDHHNRVRNDNRISNLRPEGHGKNPKNASRYSSNKSGVTGVGYREEGRRWISFWKDLQGNDCSKSFSVANFGEEAFGLAVAHRASMIASLNAQGAGYTDDHGK